MVPQQTQATVVLLMMLAVAKTVSATTTFLAVSQDAAPPPSAANTTAVTRAQCGRLCFAATVERCRAFVWRPPATLQGKATTSNISTSEGSEGRCELLRCLPHPASLTPAPGAQLFVAKTADSRRPPPAFTPSLVPSGYSMACTFAFHVFPGPRLGQWQAGRRCAQDGARLAVFKSLEEEESVSVAVQTSEPYWIGLTDRQREGVWRWADSDRTKLTYSNWERGEPNNYRRGRRDQDCVALYEGRWNDLQCRDALPFVCQVPLLHRLPGLRLNFRLLSYLTMCAWLADKADTACDF
ncbi:Collectin-12 [Chionoecetes opilio]|uniref:Collectin-12 n=1 Tax=Chionoecetes opilio TaxID=41210 RepID=A0A8J4YIM1_CHIOP|nr:Collectin-12 [Chionoecetes opilio]